MNHTVIGEAAFKLILSLKSTFSQPFKEKLCKCSGKNWQCNHLSSSE